MFLWRTLKDTRFLFLWVWFDGNSEEWTVGWKQKKMYWWMDGLYWSEREPWELQYQTMSTSLPKTSHGTLYFCSNFKKCATWPWHEKVLVCDCMIALVWYISWNSLPQDEPKRRKEIKSSSLPGAQNSCGAIGFADGSPARAFTHGCAALCMGDSTLSNPSRTIKVLALEAGGLTPLSLPPPSHSTMHQSHGLRNTEKEREAGLWSHVPFFF